MAGFNHEVEEIQVDELEAALAGGASLVDVREPDEFATARVPGARLVPLETIPGHVDGLREKELVYVICATGNRSEMAARFLEQNGVHAINVVGGTKAWIESGRHFDRG